MNTVYRLALAVLVSSAVAAPSRAAGRDSAPGNKGASVSRVQAALARPRAPQAPRLAPGAPVRPSGNNMPPAQHFDLHPAPVRPVARPETRPEARPEIRPGVRPEARPQARPEARPGVRLEGRTEVRAGAFDGRAGARGWGAPDHRSIVGSREFSGRVFAHERDEREINHVYWHADGGSKFAHWYDGKVHWYGFYNGPRFYWTRYEDNRWWWFDQTAGRWLYWHDNYWWWHDPANPASQYVVINDNYYPYSEVAADPALAPGAAPDDSNSALANVAGAGRGVHGNFAKKSPDGAREVQVYGDRREAFLYDLTGGGDPRFISFLATGVKHVQFSESAGNNLEIMLLMLDGSYDVFDANGKSILPTTGNGAPSDPGTPGADAIPAQSAAPDAAPPSNPPAAGGAPDSSSPDSAPPSGPPSIPAQ